MSYWTTKTRSNLEDTEFIVIKHKLRGINGNVFGVKFREGYAAIIKGSKVHHLLKKNALIWGSEELPILHLRKLKFISRPKDIETVYGKEVYIKYMEQHSKFLEEQKLEQEHVELEKQQKLEEEHKNANLCRFVTASGQLCRNEALPVTPSKYCIRHILNEPKLTELGIEVPKFIPKSEKKGVRESVYRKLVTLNKQ